MVGSETLKELNHELKINENVLRWIVVKRRSYKNSVDELMQMVQQQELAQTASAPQAPVQGKGADVFELAAVTAKHTFALSGATLQMIIKVIPV